MTGQSYWPKAGYEWNPLRKHRNIPCPCGSGRKAKKCHGQAEAIPEDEAQVVQDYLRQLGELRASKSEAR